MTRSTTSAASTVVVRSVGSRPGEQLRLEVDEFGDGVELLGR